MRKVAILLIALCTCLGTGAQPLCSLTDYSEHTGIPAEIMRIMVDRQGLLWAASTNGIYRYDGYEWRNFKSHAGDGTRLKTNRVKSIYQSKEGNIWSVIDNHAILFDLQKYQFVDALAEYEKLTGQTLDITKVRTLDNGTTWFITSNGHLLMTDNDQVRTIHSVMRAPSDKEANLSADEQGRTWIVTPQATYTYSNHQLKREKKIVSTSLQTVPSPLTSYLKDIDYTYDDANGTKWLFTEAGQVYYMERGDSQPHLYDKVNVNPGNEFNNTRDGKGNLWFIHRYNLMRLSFGRQPYHRFAPGQTLWYRSGMKDRQGRLWLSDKESGYVMVYAADKRFLGYLAADGTLAQAPRSFESPVYSMLQDRYGNIWLGTRTQGLYRLREDGGAFRADHFTTKGNVLGDLKIFDLKEDQQGRVWLSTEKAGPHCIMRPQDDKPQFLYVGHGLNGYQSSYCQKTYTVLPTHDGHLVVGTAEGLYVADIRGKNVGQTPFKEHQREADRPQSISCSHVSCLTETSGHRLFVGTQGGGVNEIMTKDLMADHLDFRHYDVTTGLPSDMPRTMFSDRQGGVWIIFENVVVKLTNDDREHPLCNLYFRNQQLAFTNMKPVQMAEGHWLLGTEQGAIIADIEQMERHTSDYVPPIVLTRVNIEGQNIDHAPSQTDTIVLSPGQRNVSLTFAALDYDHPQDISYAFRIGQEQSWNYIDAGGRSVSMTNLEPDTYTLVVRSTNGEGQWVDNEHRVTIIVKPTFWQTGFAKILIVTIILLVIAIIAYTILYIKRIKRQQHETLEAYLALLKKQEENEQPTEQAHETTESASVKLNEEDKAFMKRLMAYIEQNINNSDASPEEMADATATSRSSLHRKVNRLVGMTPMEFMREARVRKACQLLRESSMAVVDIAYACGYSDPKYFSKCFKQDTGMTPKQYREGN